MSAVIIPFPDFSRPKDYGLGCPICRRGRWLNVYKTHWVVCDLHRLKCCAGHGFLESWRDESEEIWQRNRTTLEGYCDDNFHVPTNAGGAA